MFSLLINAKPRKTTLVFPDEQKLWAFFASAQVSDFRIESSRHAFIGKLQQDDINLAIQKLGASEVKKDAMHTPGKKHNSDHSFPFAQLLFPSLGLMKNRTLCQ